MAESYIHPEGPIEFGVIGGTGVYAVESLQDKKEVVIDTPFGATSAPIVIGTMHGVKVAFVARHGFGHNVLPTEVPYRANIYALKLLGVRYLLSLSACGSLKLEYAPSHVVLVDQVFDRTKTRPDSFFGNGCVGHVSLADPVCPKFQALVKKATEVMASPPTVHVGGTYVCMEGPAFSTKAESNVYRNVYGCSVIGMTAVPECKLAKEAEMAYCLVAMVTDYDCWYEEHGSVTVDMVMKTLKTNGDMAQRLVSEAVRLFAEGNKPESESHSAMRFACMTPRANMTEEVWARMRPLVGKYIQDGGAGGH